MLKKFSNMVVAVGFFKSRISRHDMYMSRHSCFESRVPSFLKTLPKKAERAEACTNLYPLVGCLYTGLNDLQSLLLGKGGVLARGSAWHDASSAAHMCTT
jgi:hypothetical protein